MAVNLIELVKKGLYAYSERCREEDLRLLGIHTEHITEEERQELLTLIAELTKENSKEEKERELHSPSNSP